MRGRPPKTQPIIKREDGLVQVYGSWLSEKPECVICKGETTRAERQKKSTNYYRATCSKECLGKLKSKRSSQLVKSGIVKRQVY